MGDVAIKPHLLCAKNIRIIGIGGEAITAYGPTLEAFRRYRQHYPLEKFVTHRYSVEEADAAIRFSMTDECMKVVIAIDVQKRNLDLDKDQDENWLLLRNI